jgi:thiosulfate/3-mercaptopyruvate sulfurtransferase
VSANGEYARPELLAEPAWVWERRGDPVVRIVDCGPADAYRRAHIPGAVGLPVHHWLKDPADPLHVMGPEPFAALMASLGAAAGTTVVYDDAGGVFAARLWWALTYYGHPQVKVLDGGWRRWLAEARRITVLEIVPETTRFTARPTEGAHCGFDELVRRLKEPGFQVLDARSEREYRGALDRGNRRTGHMPGAVHVEWKQFLASEALPTLKPARELRGLLQNAGLAPEAEVVTHCQSGVRGAHAAFVLTPAGLPGAALRRLHGRVRQPRRRAPLVVE